MILKSVARQEGVVQILCNIYMIGQANVWKSQQKLLLQTHFVTATTMTLVLQKSKVNGKFLMSI